VVLAILGLSFLGGWLLPITLIAGGFYLVNRKRNGRVDWDEAVTNVRSQVERWAVAAERTLRSAMSRIEESAASAAEGRAEARATGHEGAGDDGGARAGTREEPKRPARRPKRMRRLGAGIRRRAAGECPPPDDRGAGVDFLRRALQCEACLSQRLILRIASVSSLIPGTMP
jgi:hypothetical protein